MEGHQSFERLKLLIVDDDPELAEFMRAGLKVHFSLIVVVEGVVAAKRLMEGPFVFDLIVCDYQLSDGTGMDIYQWLREVKGSHASFLMISGKVEPITVDDKSFGFLSKPFQMNKLIESLEALPAGDSPEPPRAA